MTLLSAPDSAKNAAPRRVILAPSMINADWARAGEVVSELARLNCEWLHFDAMDGQFVPNLTLGPMFLSALREHSTLHFDAHLMISTPGDYIDDFLKAGANSISVHVENQVHLHRLIAKIKDGGAMAGVALNPATPVAMLDVVLPELDYVLVMSVNPGYSGQKFLPLAISKIEELKRAREARGLQFLIEVDGGVNVQTASDVVRAGADVLVSASGIFDAKRTLSESVSALRAAVDAAL